MSDLISRSQLLKEIETWGGCVEALHEYIQNMSTAYDVDKVVSELEKNASRYTKKYVTPYGNNGYRDTKAIRLSSAIEIVKHGGVSDDVCECRLLNGHQFLHETSCGDVFDMQNGFKYCPYCGKSIKVVK